MSAGQPYRNGRRPVSVEAHRKFREMLGPEPAFDEIDEAMADPIRDRLPAAAPRHQANRVLRILDEIEHTSANRRSAT